MDRPTRIRVQHGLLWNKDEIITCSEADKIAQANYWPDQPEAKMWCAENLTKTYDGKYIFIDENLVIVKAEVIDE